MKDFTCAWMVIKICGLLFCSVQHSKAQAIKIWNADTNFLNLRNWERDSLPCPNDRVIFPKSEPVITFMPASLSIRKLVLPNNGELIFPENAHVKFAEDEQESCVGQDVKFKSVLDFWYDPVNWNITSNHVFPRTPNRRNAAVPHAFQVPCPTDVVRFPEQTTFRTHVDLPSSVARLEVNNIAYTQAQFDQLKLSHVGGLLFPDNPAIRITSRLCTDETGCVCGNEREQVMPTICNFVTPLCPELECSDPIQPDGSCCPVCGSNLTISYKRGFTIESLLQLYGSILKKSEFQGVESFTAKISADNILSVFVDGMEVKGLANRAAHTIHEAMRKDMQGNNIYKIRSVQMVKSEMWNSEVITYDKRTSGLSSAGTASLIFFFVVLPLLGAAYYFYRKRQLSGFNFARFDLRGDRIELELGTTPHDELQPEEPTAPIVEENGKGFDNPVYGTSIEEVPISEEEPAEVSEVKDFVENPMYSMFENQPIIQIEVDESEVNRGNI